MHTSAPIPWSLLLPVSWFVCHAFTSLSLCGCCLSVCPPKTHNPQLWIQGDSYPRPPPGPARLPLASIKMCLCMYVCAEGNTGRFFKGWEEISRGIWGQWIWMGSLLIESATDREVNSSWPGKAKSGRRRVIDACTGIHLGPNSISLTRCHSFTISEDYLSLFLHLMLLYC